VPAYPAPAARGPTEARCPCGFIEPADGGFSRLLVFHALRLDHAGGDAVLVYHHRHDGLVDEGNARKVGPWLHEQARRHLPGSRASRHPRQSQYAQEERALAQETPRALPFHPDPVAVAQSGRNIEQLQEHINAFIEAYNETAEPFAWTKKKVYQRRFKNCRITQP
jgi:hypothetical protein